VIRQHFAVIGDRRHDPAVFDQQPPRQEPVELPGAARAAADPAGPRRGLVERAAVPLEAAAIGVGEQRLLLEVAAIGEPGNAVAA